MLWILQTISFVLLCGDDIQVIQSLVMFVQAVKDVPRVFVTVSSQNK